MIKTTLFSITGALALTMAAQATTVSLSAGFGGPFAVLSDGTTRVNGGLVRLGTLTGNPAGSSIADIDAVFAEFGTRNTSATGGVAGSFTNVSAAADTFNGDQIYMWVFNTNSTASATEHGLFTVTNPAAPGTGLPWNFPTNAGGVGDSVSISVSALIANRDVSLPGGVSGNNIALVPVPEPSGAMLAGLAGVALLFRRRR